MRKFVRSFVFAFRGICLAYRGERNIKVQSVIGVVAVSAAFFFKIPGSDFLIIILVSAAVISLEMVNTALERLADILSPEYNRKYGIIKDIMAGAVLIMAISSAIIGVVIFYRPFMEFLGF